MGVDDGQQKVNGEILGQVTVMANPAMQMCDRGRGEKLRKLGCVWLRYKIVWRWSLIGRSTARKKTPFQDRSMRMSHINKNKRVDEKDGRRLRRRGITRL